MRTGLSFGATSGVITTLGLMVGLDAGTHSRMIVLGGIMTIAVADAFSDALGIHVSEESENKHSSKEIWQSSAYTFISKLLIALSFMIPVLLVELPVAMWISVIWGMIILSVLSVQISDGPLMKRWKVVLEHLVVAVVVIIVANYIGNFISHVFA